MAREHEISYSLREGLSQARKRRRGALPSHPGGLRAAVAPNEVWCIDFKGWFRTGDGARCDPLTVTDAFSRYLLCSQVVSAPDTESCRSELERVFREYGLPWVLRSDNGAPLLLRANASSPPDRHRSRADGALQWRAGPSVPMRRP